MALSCGIFPIFIRWFDGKSVDMLSGESHSAPIEYVEPFARMSDDIRQMADIFFLEWFQDPVADVLEFFLRTAHAESQTEEIRGGETFLNGSQAVVAVITATFFYFHAPNGQVQFIVNHHDLLGFQTVAAANLGHGLPTQVHVCLGFGEQAVGTGKFGAPQLVVAGFVDFFQTHVLAPFSHGQQVVYKHEPDIVSGLLVLRTWVPQSDNDAFVVHFCGVPDIWSVCPP